MVYPVHPSDSLHPTQDSQTPQEKQKLFEIQFETAVLSAYVSITNQNGSVKQQLSKIKNGAESGQPPDQLATSVNQVIAQINTGVIPGKIAFPSFSFSTDGAQVQAIRNFALSVEKFLNTASEKGNIHWKDEEKLFGHLSDLVYNVGQMTPEQAFNKLNGVIEQANEHLPAHFQLPTIPYVQKR